MTREAARMAQWWTVRRRAPRTGLVAALVALTMTACTGLFGGGRQPVALPTSVLTASGHGWTTGSLDGSIPPPGSCHLRWTADHEPLPDPACTPGSIDPAVRQDTLDRTVCRSGGYTSSVRPPVELTGTAKRALLRAYGIPVSQVDRYELDHLVALSIGGSSDIANLWPEPNTLVRAAAGPYVRNDKDQTEQDAFHAVCDGRLPLTTAQAQMATDWTTMSVG